ncbi:MAG: ATP-dependent DNA ligase, partial [Actinomycetales bacterium]
GTYETEKWRDDEVIVVLHGAPDGGLGGEPVQVALIRTGDNWLCHRMDVGGRKNRHTAPPVGPKVDSSVSVERPKADSFVEPMLARPGDAMDLDDQEDWAFEMKWDGVRIVAACDGASVGLRGRSGKDVTATYPEVVEALVELDLPDAVLDGEIVALAAGGAPSFSLLQQRMGLSRPGDVARARRDVSVRFCVFDVVRLDGHGLANLPYEQRRATLLDLDLETDDDVVSVPAAFDGSLEDAVASSRELGLEGVIAKRRSSRYVAGKRSSSWVKLKHQRMQEVVVVGWRPGRGERTDGIGSLLVAVQGEDGLEYAGRVGTGFTAQSLEKIGGRLRSLARKTAPVEVPRDVAKEARWVTPRLVGEVTFTEWTASGHLRHPVWRGLRDDKGLADAVRE